VKIIKVIIIAVITVIVSVGIVWLIQPTSKIAYVDFNKELEKDFEKIVTTRKYVLDSLKYQITIKNGAQDTTGLDILKRSYSYNSQVFEHNNSLLKEQYYEKIVTQLNQYVTDFGKESVYDIVLGANGNGTIMYATPKIDITDEVLVYINSKYEGK